MDRERESANMRATIGKTVKRIGPGTALLVLLSLPASAAGQEWLPLRNHNPFLQIYGLPAFQSAEIEPAGRTSWRFDFDVANHADAGSYAGERIILDGETYFLNLSLRRSFAGRSELGLEIPFIGHEGGFLDGPIENWHQLWGMSNTKRSGPRNGLRYFYENLLPTRFEMMASGWGVGDVRLSAAVPLGRSFFREGRSAALRAGVKLPTGKAQRLLGSGSTDLSLGLYATDTRLLADHDISLSAVGGVLIPGTSEVLPGIQKDRVGFGGLAASWQLTRRFALIAGIYGQTPYYESKLDEIGGNSVQLAIGGSFRLANAGTSVTVALIEDLFDNATTDFALHVSFHGAFRAGAIGT
jgi:hypothetical protein